MRQFVQNFNRYLFKEIDPIGLAVFRISYFFVVMLEVIHFYDWRHVIFDKIPYLVKSEINFQFIFLFWFIAIFFLIIGYKTRIASIVNYIFSVLIFSSSAAFEYHIFYTYVGVAFISMFTPLSAALSLDRLLDQFKSAGDQKITNSIKSYRVHYYAIILVGIGLVYFDSIFFKLDARMWINGIGMWMPASLPMATWNDTSWLLNNQYLVIFLNYFVILFEFVFLFIFGKKQFRVPIMVIGIFFHLGIYIQYPIPYFALAYIAIYLLFFPVGALRRYVNLLMPPQHQSGQIFPYRNLQEASGWLRKGVLTAFLGFASVVPVLGKWLDQALRLATEAKSPIRFSATLDLFTRKFWYIVLVFFVVSQMIITWYSPYSIVLRKQLGFTITENIEKTRPFIGFYSFIINFFGITHHGVFTDYHFKNFNHIVHIKYVVQGKVYNVPLLDERGLTGEMINGTIWRNIAFNVITPNITQEKMETGIVPYLRYYVENYHSGDYSGHFIFYGKEIEVPSSWKQDQLRHNMAQPWSVLGRASFQNYSVVFSWNSAMKDLLQQERKTF